MATRPKPEYFHTLSQKLIDTDYIPNFKFPKNPTNYEDFLENKDKEGILHGIMVNPAFFVKEKGENMLKNDYKSLNKKNNKEYNLDDIEIFKANEYRLEALDTGNPRDELERLDKQLFNFYKEKEEYYDENRNEAYDRLVDPLLDKIKFPERYDIDSNNFF